LIEIQILEGIMTVAMRARVLGSMGATVLGLLLTASLTQGCAPSRAKIVREQRNTTIGLLGASYRPNGNIGVGISASGAKDEVEVDREKKSYANSKSDDANVQMIAETSSMVSPFVHYYPWDTSAFFVGAGANFTKSRYQYEAEKEGSTTLAPAYTEVNYEVSATDLHMPLGWNWIWENGITLMLDFGPSTTVAYAGRYSNDGGDGGVNATQRDESIAALDSAKKGAVRFSLGSIIGYSF